MGILKKLVCKSVKLETIDEDGFTVYPPLPLSAIVLEENTNNIAPDQASILTPSLSTASSDDLTEYTQINYRIGGQDSPQKQRGKVEEEATDNFIVDEVRKSLNNKRGDRSVSSRRSKRTSGRSVASTAYSTASTATYSTRTTRDPSVRQGVVTRRKGDKSLQPNTRRDTSSGGCCSSDSPTCTDMVADLVMGESGMEHSPELQRLYDKESTFTVCFSREPSAISDDETAYTGYTGYSESMYSESMYQGSAYTDDYSIRDDDSMETMEMFAHHALCTPDDRIIASDWLR